MLVGCVESQQPATATETPTVEPVAEVPAQPPPLVDAKPAEPFVGAIQSELQTDKAPDITLVLAAQTGNIESVNLHIQTGTDLNLS